MMECGFVESGVKLCVVWLLGVLECGSVKFGVWLLGV